MWNWINNHIALTLIICIVAWLAIGMVHIWIQVTPYRKKKQFENPQMLKPKARDNG